MVVIIVIVLRACLFSEYTSPNTVALVGGRSLGRNKSSGLASSYTCAGSPLLGHRKIRRSTKELGSKTLSKRAGIIPKNLTWLRHCAAATARNSFGSHRSVGRAQTHFSSRRANKWSSTSVTLQVQGITILSKLSLIPRPLVPFRSLWITRIAECIIKLWLLEGSVLWTPFLQWWWCSWEILCVEMMNYHL